MKEHLGPARTPIGDENVDRLTKREYFAAMMMQGLISSTGYMDGSRKELAAMAIAHSDELLKQLEK